MIKRFDIEDLDNFWDHDFDDCDDDHVEQLASSMRDSGWIGDPIVVAQWSSDPDGTHRIINGRHRALAADMAGIEIVAHVISYDDFSRLEAECSDLEDVARRVLSNNT